MEIDVEKYFKPDLKKARKRNNETVQTINFNVEPKYEALGAGKFYHILSFGCQANEADSEIMAGILEKLDFKSSIIEKADIIVINTCAIRENAENRTFGEIGRLSKYKKSNPNLLLVLAGCMPQEETVVKRVTETYKNVDIILGTHNIHNLPEYIYKAYNSKSNVIEVYSIEGNIVENLPKVRNNSHKAWVNIMYGCDEFCTYCIVPYTRGKERSRESSEIIKEVEELVKNNVLEVTLLGQNVNAYRSLTNPNYKFSDLLDDLAKTNIKRIRFTTSHPKDLDEETLIQISKYPNIMPSLHLPMQSGSNNILKKMNRHYTIESYLNLIKLARLHNPDISITTDIIVGFPNETNEEFLETISIVKEVNFEGAYTFIYSKRDGTPAASFPDNVLTSEKELRLKILNETINELYKKGNSRFVNKIVTVLVDSISKNNTDYVSGYSEHNKLVNFKGSSSLIGKLVYVRITEAKTWFMMGEEVSEVEFYTEKLLDLLDNDNNIKRFAQLDVRFRDPKFLAILNEFKSKRRKLIINKEDTTPLTEKFLEIPLLHEYLDLKEYIEEIIKNIKNAIEIELSEQILLEN